MSRPGRHTSSRPDPGFSLPFVPLTALMVLLGALLLANRSSDGVRQLTSAFTEQAGTTSTAVTRPGHAAAATQADGGH